MHNLLGIYTIWYRDILRFWHDRIRLMGAITFPLLFLFVFGSGLSARLGSLGSGVNFVQFMYPGIIGMTVLMSSFTAGISVVWDREFGFLKEVLVAPINRGSVAIGKTLGSATIALAQGVLIMLLAPLIGVSFSVWSILTVLPLMLLLAIIMGSLGVLIATRIRSMEAFQAVMQMLLFPIIFLSGVFFPLDGLPSWMNVIVKLNPATYGIASIRQVILGSSTDTAFSLSLFGHTMSIWNNVTVLAAFGAVILLLAMWSFSNQE
ncbi:ABC transporter permease [Chloroflexota bacterium]